MIDLGPHTNFILTAYSMAAFVLALLVIWVVADHRAQVRAIDALESKGVSRRSGARSR